MVQLGWGIDFFSLGAVNDLVIAGGLLLFS